MSCVNVIMLATGFLLDDLYCSILKKKVNGGDSNANDVIPFRL